MSYLSMGQLKWWQGVDGKTILADPVELNKPLVPLSSKRKRIGSWRTNNLTSTCGLSRFLREDTHGPSFYR